jgi:sugar phosphate isomerase/epimerase
MRTVSVSTVLFDGYPLEKAFEEIAASGARSVEPAFIKGYIDFDESAFSEGNARRLARLIADAGLGVRAVSAHLDLACEGAVEMVRQRIAFAATLGAQLLITNAGAVSRRGRVLETITAVLTDCAAANVSLALENPGHGSGNLIVSGAKGAALVSAVGSPHVRLNYDVGNIFTYSRERLQPEEDIADAMGAVAHLHLKDVASDRAGWRFTAIGDGAIDYRALWRALPADLPVGIELPLRLDRSGRADPIRRKDPVPLPDIRRALRRSLGFVAELEAATEGA